MAVFTVTPMYSATMPSETRMRPIPISRTHIVDVQPCTGAGETNADATSTIVSTTPSRPSRMPV